MIYSSDPQSLMETQSKEPASWSDRIYFSGYVMFTLGNGDLAPNGGLWKLVTIIETAQGLLTITFSVTYLISVLSAVNQKRSFAQSVLSLGMTEQKSSIMHGMAKIFTTLIFFLSLPHQNWES